jgi:hypothetical protein
VNAISKGMVIATVVVVLVVSCPTNAQENHLEARVNWNSTNAPSEQNDKKPNLSILIRIFLSLC